ncbi:LysR family transcriptional regulator [Pseudidiomarina terrestris]|uniref:LysR family transcriptional regulator n=1 Tax=Pseudidiomarina terrestris TaxID=2820060 RepID=UPI00264AEC84|nr:MULTISPECIES: LysR family transcriptional regulator [unclassified Pseudidiomarina]MDN7126880.1 LysR family transcriptional regulator [Pseudidiomarina sp. 1APR75-33.1]MDN7134601.1 LysR family transcriptional regulator [Pseudidiomarina sp. 1ASP75-5]MDN7136729.1 LysR family transcriptional regulator [Pseudidiomarina sp. 1ASP75-14]MEA3587611.1 LysR family transcriptional regulator [Pseudidiomarina sp. 1APP75-27a]
MSSSWMRRDLTDYDLKLLKVFRTVVECGGFSAAETELGIGRSTISIHMNSLETRLGLRLCQRGRQGFSLTREGQAVFNAILTLTDAHDEFQHQLAQINQDLSGELILLAADQLDAPRQRNIAKAIGKITAEAPQLHIHFDLLPLQQIELALLKNQAHVALMPGYRRIDGLSYTPAFSTPIYLCCGAEHPLFARPDTELDDPLLAGFDAIHPGININPEGRKLLQRLNTTARAYQFDSRLSLILSGAYLGFLPDAIAAPYLASGELRYIRPDTYQYAFEQFYVRRNQPREPEKVELALTALLAASANESGKKGGM